MPIKRKIAVVYIPRKRGIDVDVYLRPALVPSMSKLEKKLGLGRAQILRIAFLDYLKETELLKSSFACKFL